MLNSSRFFWPDSEKKGEREEGNGVHQPNFGQFVLDSMSESMLWMDSEGTIVFVNSTFCRLVATESKDLVGQSISHVDPHFNPISWEQFWIELSEKKKLRSERLLRNNHGETVPVDATDTWIVFEGKEYCSSLLKDARELKSTESKVRELLRQANQYRFALDQSSIVATLDPDGKLIYANEKFYRFTLFSQKEAEGLHYQKWSEEFHPEAFFENLWTRISTGKVWRGELCVRDKEGSKKWIDSTIVPFFNQWGLPDQYMLIGTDITERNLQAEKIRESESVLREAQRLAKIGNYKVDLVTGRSTWSEQAARNYGLKPLSDIEGVDWSKLIHPEDQAEFARVWNEAIEHGKDFSFTHRVISGKGEVLIHQTIGRCVLGETDGKTIQIIGTSQDITEKQRQQDLLRDQELRLLQSSKMSALGQMAGGVAHEINNPLAIIHANASMMQEMGKSQEIQVSSLLRYSEKIIGTVERIAKIIQGLKTFAYDDSHAPFQDFQISRSIQETLDFCESRFRSAGIELKVAEVPEELKAEVRPTQISQVLLNLLNNAYDAVLPLPTKWVSIECKDLGKWIEIHVTDSGQGIDKKIADRIMEPFFTTKEVGKGSGLGLSISSGIMKGHQGTLILDRGSANTCFKMRFPKSQSDTSAPGREQAA